MNAEVATAIDQQPLEPPRSLRAGGDRLVGTRLALHRLAEEAISPARRLATTKIGLRATPDGFGTPPFAGGVQIRVAGTQLVVTGPDGERGAEISTLTAAGELIGRDALPPDATLDDAPLAVDADSAALLADWYALGATVLLELRAAAGPAADPSLIQLWPEHFDLAVELGSQDAGARANYGFSPGDEDNAEPYAYVGPWVAPSPGPLWNASSFPGAQLDYADVLDAADPKTVVLDFMRARLAALGG